MIAGSNVVFITFTDNNSLNPFLLRYHSNGDFHTFGNLFAILLTILAFDATNKGDSQSYGCGAFCVTP